MSASLGFDGLSVRKIRCAVWVLTLVALPAACHAGPDPAPSSPKPAGIATHDVIAANIRTPAGDEVCQKIAFDEAPLADAISALGMQAGLNVMMGRYLLSQPSADGTPLPPPNVTVKWQNVTPLQALEALLDNNNLQMTNLSGSNLRVGVRDTNTAGKVRVKVNLLEKEQTNGPVPGGNEVLSEISFDSAPLLDAFRAMALQAEWNIQFEPGLPDPSVTFKMKNVTVRQVMQALLEEHGLQMTRLPGNPILRIGAKDPKVPDAPAKPAQSSEGGAKDPAAPTPVPPP